MTDEIERKANLAKLIPLILEDEKNMEDFVFFLNSVENLGMPTDEIQHVLKDYLCVVVNIPVKGKNRVRCIGDRQVLKCKENIGFIDAIKIEIIAKAVIDNTKVSLPITIHDFKRRYRKNILRNVEVEEGYREFLKKYQEGDDIFEVVSSLGTGEQVFVKPSVIMQRDGENIAVILKGMK